MESTKTASLYRPYKTVYTRRRRPADQFSYCDAQSDIVLPAQSAEVRPLPTGTPRESLCSRAAEDQPGVSGRGRSLRVQATRAVFLRPSPEGACARTVNGLQARGARCI